MVAQAPAPAQGAITFLRAAKRRNHRLGNIAYASDPAPRIVNLRNAGYLESLGLAVKSSGTYATAGPTGVDDYGKFGGPIDRITLLANSVGVLYDVNGYFAAVISALHSNYKYATPFSLTKGIPDSFTATPATAAFANVWTYEIPIAIDFANLPYPVGLYQLALNAQEVQLQLRHTAIGVATASIGSGVYVGNPANLGSSVAFTEVHQRFFDPIPQLEAQPPLSVAHTWRQFRYFLTGDGDNEIMLPTGGWYTRIIYQVVMGATTATLAPNRTAVTRLRMTYGSNVTPYDETRDEAEARQYRSYGAALPTGMYIHDWLEDTHTERDLINSRAVTDLRAIISTSGGSYAGGAFVDVVVEQLLPIDVNSLPVVGAQGVA
jgi:hypothetical protein